MARGAGATSRRTQRSRERSGIPRLAARLDDGAEAGRVAHNDGSPGQGDQPLSPEVVEMLVDTLASGANEGAEFRLRHGNVGDTCRSAVALNRGEHQQLLRQPVRKREE